MIAIRFLQTFMDPDAVRKQFFSSLVGPPELHAMVHKSQLTEEYGGTAPIPKVFWPPIMPEMPEQAETPEHDVIPRDQYVEFWSSN